MGKIDKLLTEQPTSMLDKAAKLAALEDLKREVENLIDHYKTELLADYQKADLWLLKAGNYTISRVPRITPHVDNFILLKEALEKADIPVETKEVFSDLMKPVFRQLAEDNREMPGFSYTKIEYIALRPTGKHNESKK